MLALITIVDKDLQSSHGNYHLRVYGPVDQQKASQYGNQSYG